MGFAWPRAAHAVSCTCTPNNSQDLDCDGYRDVVVGEQGTNRVKVFYGSATGLDTTRSTVITGPTGSMSFGEAVIITDTNQDGCADIVVSDPGTQTVYTYFGNSGAAPDTTYDGSANISGTQFGYALADAGDVNNDGYEDVAVSDYKANKVYVLKGSTSGETKTGYLTIPAPLGALNFGYSLAGNVDIDNDGAACDLVVGAPNLAGGSTAGAVYMYYCKDEWPSSGSYPSNHKISAPSGALQPAYFGSSVAAVAGNVSSGTGYASIAVGDPNDSTFVYSATGSGATLTDTLVVGTQPGDITVCPTSPNSQLGSTVGFIADANGDSIPELASGGPGLSQVLIFDGKATGLHTAGDACIDGGTGELGDALAGGAGSFDGTVHGDLVLGAPGNNEAYLFLGSGSGTGFAYTSYISSTNPNFHPTDTMTDGSGDFGCSVDGSQAP